MSQRINTLSDWQEHWKSLYRTWECARSPPSHTKVVSWKIQVKFHPLVYPPGLRILFGELWTLFALNIMDVDETLRGHGSREPESLPRWEYMFCCCLELA